MHEHNDLREYKPLHRTATSILDPSQVWVILEGVLLSFSRVPWGLQQHFVPLWMDICPSLSSFWNLGTSRSTHALPLRHPTSFRARVDGSIHRSNVKASRTSCNSATDMACNALALREASDGWQGSFFYNSPMEIKWSFHRLLGPTWAIQGLFHGSLWFTWSCRYPTSSYETRGTCRATMATPRPRPSPFSCYQFLEETFGKYPLMNIQKAIENGHRNSGFPHEKKCDFPWQNVSSPEGIYHRLGLDMSGQRAW